MTDWRDKAKCVRDGADLELFFSNDWRQWRDAKAFCAECPVRRQCLGNALETESIYGVWGGVDQYEIRRALALDQKGDPRAVPKDQMRCPFCFSRDLSTIDKRRSRSLVACNDCKFEWRRRSIGSLPKMRKETKPSDEPKPDGDVGDAVSAGS